MNSKFKMILTLGALMSVPMILMSVLSYVFNLGNNPVYSWIVTIVWVLVIFFTQLYYRNNYYKGYASYSQLFGGSFLMVCVASLLMAVFTFILYKFIAPELIEKMIQASRATLYENSVLSDSQIESALEMSRKWMTPGFITISGFFGYLLQGTVISLITSAINKKKMDGFQEAMKEISDQDED